MYPLTFQPTSIMNLSTTMRHALSIFSICALLSTQTVYAQLKDNREKLQIGIKAGGNVSSIYNVKSNNFTGSPSMGYAGGVFLSVPIGKFLGIQPEIQYSQLGFIGKGSISGSDYNYTRVTDYITIPLLLQLKTISGLTILGGVQYAYLVGRSDVFKTGGITSQQQQNIENTNIRKNTMGIVGGFDINLNHFVIAARTGMDLMNNNGNGTSTNPTYTNIWAQTMIGLKF
jgi:hypothetical protein